MGHETFQNRAGNVTSLAIENERSVDQFIRLRIVTLQMRFRVRGLCHVPFLTFFVEGGKVNLNLPFHGLYCPNTRV
jgi:hypothetical protein